MLWFSKPQQKACETSRPGLGLGLDRARARVVLRLYLAFALFVAVVWASTMGRAIRTVYINDGVYLLVALVALTAGTAAERLWTSGRRGLACLVVAVVLVPSVGMTGRWALDYRRSGPVAQACAGLSRQVIDDLLAAGQTEPITIQFADIGLLEYLSDERVRPLHLFEHLEREGLGFEGVVPLLRRMDTGSIVFSLDLVDDGLARSANREAVRRALRRVGLEVTWSRTYRRGEIPAFWVVRFSRVGPAPPAAS